MIQTGTKKHGRNSSLAVGGGSSAGAVSPAQMKINRPLLKYQEVTGFHVANSNYSILPVCGTGAWCSMAW